MSALEIASTEGRAVPVSGVTSVTTTVGHQGVKFPLEEYTNVTQLFVGPAVESVPITLNVGGVEKTITLLRSRTKDKVILRSEPDSIVFFNFTFSLGKTQHNVNYKVQFENAKNIACPAYTGGRDFLSLPTWQTTPPLLRYPFGSSAPAPAFPAAPPAPAHFWNQTSVRRDGAFRCGKYRW